MPSRLSSTWRTNSRNRGATSFAKPANFRGSRGAWVAAGAAQGPLPARAELLARTWAAGRAPRPETAALHGKCARARRVRTMVGAMRLSAVHPAQATPERGGTKRPGDAGIGDHRGPARAARVAGASPGMARSAAATDPDRVQVEIDRGGAVAGRERSGVTESPADLHVVARGQKSPDGRPRSGPGSS